jgi:hypothetical protein
MIIDFRVNFPFFSDVANLKCRGWPTVCRESKRGNKIPRIEFPLVDMGAPDVQRRKCLLVITVEHGQNIDISQIAQFCIEM